MHLSNQLPRVLVQVAMATTLLMITASCTNTSHSKAYNDGYEYAQNNDWLAYQRATLATFDLRTDQGVKDMCKLTEQTIEWTNTSDQQITQADAADYIRGCVSGMRDRYHIKPESQKSGENQASNVPNPSEEVACADRQSIPNKYQTFSEAPLVAPAASKLTFVTNCGSISMKLDKKAPVTSQIMTNLALKHYFDHSPCHRLTTEGIFILQCGDPQGDGTGGPGFTFADENLPSTAESARFNYQRGTVAMANSGPNTNGSQFFIVYDTTPLPPNYSIWGHVTSGMSVIDAIAKGGVSTGSTDGTPTLDVQIESVNVN